MLSSKSLLVHLSPLFHTFRDSLCKTTGYMAGNTNLSGVAQSYTRHDSRKPKEGNVTQQLNKGMNKGMKRNVTQQLNKGMNKGMTHNSSTKE